MGGRAGGGGDDELVRGGGGHGGGGDARAGEDSDEARRGLVDFDRIEDMLNHSPQSDHRMTGRVTPLAAPLLLEYGRVPITGQARERLAEAEAAALMAEAGLA